MRSFFTSSLDKIDPPSPYVNAMSWEAYRSQFRTTQSGKSGNRNCVLASGSLNPDSAVLSGTDGQAHIIPLLAQNTAEHRFRIELQPDLQSLASLDVDACFGDGDIGFLMEKPSETTWLECNATNEASYDDELGLLESVQEIAIALSRATPKRSVSTKKAVN